MSGSVAAPAPPTPAAPPPAHDKGPADTSAAWQLSDRIGLAVCWAFGLLFCAIAAAIVVYLLVKGIQYVRPEMLWTPSKQGFSEAESGGFSDALIGTLIVATMGIAIAVPVGVGDRRLADRVRPAVRASRGSSSRRSRRSPASPRSSWRCSGP